jgi:hypothetical protein
MRRRTRGASSGSRGTTMATLSGALPRGSKSSQPHRKPHRDLPITPSRCHHARLPSRRPSAHAGRQGVRGACVHLSLSLSLFLSLSSIPHSLGQPPLLTNAPLPPPTVCLSTQMRRRDQLDPSCGGDRAAALPRLCEGRRLAPCRRRCAPLGLAHCACHGGRLPPSLVRAGARAQHDGRVRSPHDRTRTTTHARHTHDRRA